MARHPHESEDNGARWITPETPGTSNPTAKEVKQVRLDSRQDFTDSISDHGGSKMCYPIATKRVEARVFRNGRPVGKRDQWDTEDQQRIAVGEKSAAKRIREYGASGDTEIVTQAGNGAADANRQMNEKGVQSVWDWMFRPKNYWEDRQNEPEPPMQSEPDPPMLEAKSTEPPIDELENTNLVQDLGSFAKWLIGM